tara:strand:+ start:5713 stop:5901 length:189 start_codon:yes stop_codon:yes gene_type:complete
MVCIILWFCYGADIKKVDGGRRIENIGNGISEIPNTNVCSSIGSEQLAWVPIAEELAAEDGA